MPLPLKDIISALINEVSIASIRADISRSHLQDVYDDNEIFREFSPSRVRISDLSISIPLAIDEIPKENIVMPVITSRQLMHILPSEIPVEERRRYANVIREMLLDKELHLLSNDINREISETVLSVAGIKEEDLNIAYLNKLKRDYVSRPNEDREAKFIYRVNELEKISSEHLVRIDLSVDVN